MMTGYMRANPLRNDTLEQWTRLKAFGCEEFEEESDDGSVWTRLTGGLQTGDTVVVTDLARLNKTPKDFVKMATNLLEANWGFISLDDDLDTKDIKKSEFFHICIELDSCAKALNYERVKTHLHNKKSTTETQKKSNRFPSKDDLANPDKIKDALKPNLEKLALAKQRIDAGESVRIVAKDLSINLSTLYRIIGAKPPPPDKLAKKLAEKLTLTAAKKAKSTQTKVNSENQ